MDADIDQTGAQHAVVTVTDGGGLFAVQELDIVVTTNIGNRLPVITSTAVVTHEISACPNPPDEAWVTQAPMLTPRYSPGVAVSGNQIYAIGGCNSGVCGDTQTAFVESYDPATELWAPRAPMSIARGWLAASEINGLIYAVGGSAPPCWTANST